MTTTGSTLQRTLGMWAIVALGLGYMTPTVVFDTFGIVSDRTHGTVPTSYLIALVVMLFTAISYGKMVRIFPSAGSAYTYTRKTMHPVVGFLVGWAALLDYLLLPMVNALIIRQYLESVFPGVPAWVWVLAFVGCVTAVNAWSMRSTSRLNTALFLFAVSMVAAFLVLISVQLAGGPGQGTAATLDPLWNEGTHLAALLAGSTIVAFSFIGFDAVTMYTEEARDERTVPRAILLTVLIGGVLYFVCSWFTQAAFPTNAPFAQPDNTTPELGMLVGGPVFQALFLAGAFGATAASGLASHASVSRLLHVMGRNGVLPAKRMFAHVHPRTRTPAYTVVFVGVVSLLAIAPSLELIASVINFGALIAFTFVNLAVLAHYVVRERRVHSAPEVLRYVVMPLVGAALTGVLWYFLSADALVAGLVWTALGFGYVLVLTRGFRRPLDDLELVPEQEAAPDADSAEDPDQRVPH
ncbi:APC family permease [Salinifilum aidingensis]